MEYQELICRVADETNYTRREIRKIFRAMARVMRTAVSVGRDVQFVGLGRFQNYRAKARRGRHIRTGQIIHIPACQKLRFRPCDDMQEALDRATELLTDERLSARYGLETIKEPEHGDRPDGARADRPPEDEVKDRRSSSRIILQGRRNYGKVRRRDRPEQGPEGKEGGGGG